MAYKYEKKVLSALRNIGALYNSNINYRMADEVEETYAKAKAFDVVIKKVKTEFVSEDLADSIRTLVNDYEYDMEEK